MSNKRKTAIVTGASQGIGAAVANLFIERGYNVVANSRRISQSNELQRSDNLALVDGDIAQRATADEIVAVATSRFGSIDALVTTRAFFSRNLSPSTRRRISGRCQRPIWTASSTSRSELSSDCLNSRAVAV